MIPARSLTFKLLNLDVPELPLADTAAPAPAAVVPEDVGEEVTLESVEASALEKPDEEGTLEDVAPPIPAPVAADEVGVVWAKDDVARADALLALAYALLALARDDEVMLPRALSRICS